jgi:hypothetical protein
MIADSIVSQAWRVAAFIDRRLIALCLALISIDLFFVAVHAAHTIYASIYFDRVPVLGWMWHIGYDRSYLEIFGYLKMMVIIGLLIAMLRRDRPVYLALAIIFVFALLDDSLEIHETLGARIADGLALRPFAGLRLVDFGELLFWASAGVVLLSLAAIGVVRTAGRDRANGLLLLGALAVLMVFAVGVDMAHVVVDNLFRGADLLFTVIEEGGQQITLSLTCGLAILIRREVRSRERVVGDEGQQAADPCRP